MAVKCKDIIRKMNDLAQENLAEEWDNVGLLIGDPEEEINTVLVALDAVPEVIDEAIKLKADLIITHHPLIFKAIKSITRDKPLGKVFITSYKTTLVYIVPIPILILPMGVQMIH